MNPAGNGHPLDSGVYHLEGFCFSLRGSGGEYRLTPQCIVWPQLGSDMNNQIALEVSVEGGKFSAQVMLEGPLAMLYRLVDELDELLGGMRSEVKFPSERAIQDLMLPTILHITLDPKIDTGATMRCEAATPFLPSRAAPHTRQQLQSERCVANLSLISSIDLDCLEPFRDDLSRFLDWLGKELPGPGKMTSATG